MSTVVRYFPDSIRDRRIEMKKTMKECADHLVVSITTYRNAEKGDSSFDLITLKKLAAYLDVDVIYFFHPSWPITIAPHQSWFSKPRPQ